MTGIERIAAERKRQITGKTDRLWLEERNTQLST
jgi:hypothetical protein